MKKLFYLCLCFLMVSCSSVTKDRVYGNGINSNSVQSFFNKSDRAVCSKLNRLSRDIDFDRRYRGVTPYRHSVYSRRDYNWLSRTTGWHNSYHSNGYHYRDFDRYMRKTSYYLNYYKDKYKGFSDYERVKSCYRVNYFK